MRSPSSKLPITTGKQTNNMHRKGNKEGKKGMEVTTTNFRSSLASDFFVPLSFCPVLSVLKCYIELPIDGQRRGVAMVSAVHQERLEGTTRK